MVIEPDHRVGWCRKLQLTVSLYLLHLTLSRELVMHKGTKTQRLYGINGRKLSAGIPRCRIQGNALIQPFVGD